MPHESILKAQPANAAKPVGHGYPVASSSSLQTRSAQEMLVDLAKQEEDDDRRKKEREAQKVFWNQKVQQEEEDKKWAAAAAAVAATKKKKAPKVSPSLIIFRSLLTRKQRSRVEQLGDSLSKGELVGLMKPSKVSTRTCGSELADLDLEVVER